MFWEKSKHNKIKFIFFAASWKHKQFYGQSSIKIVFHGNNNMEIYDWKCGGILITQGKYGQYNSEKNIFSKTMTNKVVKEKYHELFKEF